MPQLRREKPSRFKMTENYKYVSCKINLSIKSSCSGGGGGRGGGGGLCGLMTKIIVIISPTYVFHLSRVKMRISKSSTLLLI